MFTSRNDETNPVVTEDRTMSYHNRALAAALALSAAMFGHAQAADHPPFSIPAVIGAAYYDARIATTAAEVRRQGGFAIPAAAQWLPAAPSTAAAAEIMWFADAYGTAYYKLDQGNRELVVRVEKGSKDGNPVIIRRKFSEGAVETVSIDGVGRNQIRTTLVVSRTAGTLSAAVTTDRLPQQQASN